MLFAGLPELVREGDNEQPTVTIRNAASAALDVTVSAVATPVALDGHRYTAVTPAPQSVQLAAGEARELYWPFGVPGLTGSIEWQFKATAPGVAGDALRLAQRVIAWPGAPAVYQSTLQRVDQPRRVSIARPADAIAGRGGVRVLWSPSLVGSLAGVRDYMQRYPYDCLEQRVSRAVALHDAAAWQAIGDDLPTLLDANGLARFFPADWLEGSDVLTAYVLSIAAEAGFELPEAERTRMLYALEALATGKHPYRGLFRPGDETLRRLITLEALSRYGRLTPAMLEPLTLHPEIWPTSALLDWYSIHKHAADLPERAARLAAAAACCATASPGRPRASASPPRRATACGGCCARRTRTPRAHCCCSPMPPTGARSCRDSRAARSRASGAATGTRRWPTPGARWRCSATWRASSTSR